MGGGQVAMEYGKSDCEPLPDAEVFQILKDRLKISAELDEASILEAEELNKELTFISVEDLFRQFTI